MSNILVATNQNNPATPRMVSTAGSYSNAATTDIIRVSATR
jgi:hypothetical protein